MPHLDELELRAISLLVARPDAAQFVADELSLCVADARDLLASITSVCTALLPAD